MTLLKQSVVIERTGSDTPRVAILANTFQPYRIYMYRRIVAGIPEVRFWCLVTHHTSLQRWQGVTPPPEIGPVDFSQGEPSNEQTQQRFMLREWRKGGRIIKWLKRHQVDAVLCEGFGDLARLRVLRWCFHQGIPCFLTGDSNIQGDVHPTWKAFLKRKVVGQAVRWSQGVMPCGEHGRAFFARYGARPETNFFLPIIPEYEVFLDPPPAAVEHASEDYRLDQQRRRIVFVARMQQVKRPDLAIQAFARIAEERPDWDLLLLGDGPLREKYAAMVPPHLEDRVIWTGFVHDRELLSGIYAQSDVLLLPSEKEPWGMVVIEAAAAGLALVLSDVVGAAPELLQDGRNGYLFPAGDLARLTEALRRVTHSDKIDQLKSQSCEVLTKWMAESDPVDGVRNALRFCGILPTNGRGVDEQRGSKGKGNLPADDQGWEGIQTPTPR